MEAPSYYRRVSDLLRAANEPTVAARDSIASTGITTSDSQRSSVDGAVVGMARTASLSVRAKALLTQRPSLGLEGQDLTLPYLVPSPSTSVGPSETSLMLAPSIVTRVAPRMSPDTDQEGRREVGTSSFASPLRANTIKAPQVFPENVYESQQSPDDRGDEISLQRFQSRDMPHSAVPLNQSTPFQNYFPSAGNPSAYKHPKQNGSFTPPGGSMPSRSYSQSKRRSSVITTLSRASSRAARAMSWFRKKPLPSLPPSPTLEKQGKTLPNPDDDLTVPDLVLRAAAMDHYLSVGELPYTSPRSSPAPFEQSHARRASAPRASMASVLSSFSDRARERRMKPAGFSQIPEPKPESIELGKTHLTGCLASRRRTVIFFVALWVALAVSIPIGVVFGRRALTRNDAVSNCADGLAGVSCQLSML